MIFGTTRPAGVSSRSIHVSNPPRFHKLLFCEHMRLGTKGNDIETGQPQKAFVDYVSPKKAILPPAKWKLGILIVSGVYFSFWLQSEAGLVVWMINNLRIHFNLALFIFLWIAVGCLSYGYLDVLSYLVRIKVKDEWYGIVSWLKQPRTQWVHEYNGFLVVCCRVVVTILEDGFSIFNAPPPQLQKPAVFEQEGDHNQESLLRIEVRIQKEKVKEYEAIRDQIISSTHLNDNPGVLKIGIENPSLGNYVILIWFRTIDDLNEFMESPIRQRMVRKIRPLLQTPSRIQLLKERDLPDAFTDLLNPHGQPVPQRPPKKWKVWFLSTLSIYLVVRFTNNALPHYLSEWNLIDVHDRLQTIVTVSINVFLNSYLMTPFVNMIFGLWLVRPARDEEGDLDEPWRTLNDGFRSMWGKAAICLVFYGSLALAWMV